jgi:non-ribosomal peptide synthetase-like protein
MRAGWHSCDGAVGWAAWFCDHVMDQSHHKLFPLFASVFTRPWLRLHGFSIGRGTEVSTAAGLSRLVRLGAVSFVADAPQFAAVRAHRGWLELAPIEVGDRTFIGNGAILEGGSWVGDDCLIGIETNAPRVAPDRTSWFGTPAIEFPRVPDAVDPRRTTSPPARLRAARTAMDFLRVIVPSTIALVLGIGVFAAFEAIAAGAGTGVMVVAGPLVLAAAGVVAASLTVAVKWLLIGRYAPSEHPFWSSFVWRDEMVNSCQEVLAAQWLLEDALGTPIMSAYLRAMGARVGRDVWCETLAVTEFDVVRLGNGAAINREACVETHLFHDRLLRIGPTDVGDDATLGPISAILPNTRLGPRAVIGGRGVVLRGEELPAGTRWHGAPAVGW